MIVLIRTLEPQDKINGFWHVDKKYEDSLKRESNKE